MSRDYDLPPTDLLVALGTLLVAFSELEETAYFAISYPFGEHSDRAQALAAGTMFRGLIDKFGALYQGLPLRNHTPEDVHAFCKHLQGLNSERNRIIHAVWLPLDDGTVHTASRRREAHNGLFGKSTPITAAAIMDLVDRLDAAAHKLLEYALSADAPPTHASIS